MKLPMSLPNRGPLVRSDMGWVLLWTALTFALSSAFELQERLARAALRFEAWQVDEIPITLVALSLGLAWYAWRRRVESARLLARNHELAQQLIAVQEGERLALARELHDELAQHCTAIRIEASYIQRSRDLDRIGASARRAATSAELLQEGVRRLLRRLRPADLDALGVVAALQSLCRDWQQRSGVACAFRHEGELQGLGEAVDTTVYRVAQEALANVMRHAQAGTVRIDLRSTDAGLQLSVEDDGRGFGTSEPTQGLGLLGASERAAALGGRIEMRSRPGSGTRVRMQLPLRRGVAS